VLYPVSQVGGVMGTVMKINPMTPILEAYRDVILRGHLPDPSSFMITTAAAAVFLLISWITFHRAEYAFAENV
jgi:ABC-type polysaccharide/polyol phosphate export permease